MTSTAEFVSFGELQRESKLKRKSDRNFLYLPTRKHD